MSADYPWERPLGATPTAGGFEFRVWAPNANSILLRVDGRDVEMTHAGYGVYEAVADGRDYVYVVDGEELPDPATRWQPHGLRGASRVLDPSTFEWSDGDFYRADDHVIYELHVGTFTREGTFRAAIARLGDLADLGVTAIELMPIAEFPGNRGWGYDGVYLHAAQSTYGGPHGLAELVDAAHEAGLAVIVDVVYNHVGASGVTALEAFGPYFTDKYETFWGRAINYDSEHCDPVREWVLQSAVRWVRDFHVDGLRLDALHAIFDQSAEHIVAQVTRRAHECSALVIAESGLNDPNVMRGWGCDMVWADDFHHALHTLLTGERDGWYEEFGAVAQLAKAYHRPHVHDGQYSTFRRRRFGAPADEIAPKRFIVFSQNHDQVGNRAFGDRLPVHAQRLAALCVLFAAFTPMLFMGEEYGERRPFLFFSDHIDQEIAVATREGRRREFASFAGFDREVPDPQDPATFGRSKLSWGIDESLRSFYAELIRLRNELPPGDADAIDYDERSLRVRRGPYELIANFSSEPLAVACDTVVLATFSAAGGPVEVPALGGAVIT